MKRGLAIALFISLAANIFLGGFVAGRVLGGPHGFKDGHGKFAVFDRKMRGPKGEGRGPFFDGALMFPAIDALPPEKRDLFRENFEENREVLFANRNSLIEKRKTFTDTLTADPWDRAKAEAALADLKKATDAQEATLAKLLIDVFEKLTPEERNALVTATTERDKRWREGPHVRRFRDGPRGGPGGPDDDMGPPPPGFGDDMGADAPADDEAPPPREE